MVCIISNTGRKIISNVLLLEARIPKGIPINIQNKTAVNIIANVVIVSCHKSTRSIKIKLTPVINANFNPLVLKAINMNIKTTNGNGMKLKRLSNPFNTLSIGADSFLKSGLWVNYHSLIFFSIHSAIGMYTS